MSSGWNHGRAYIECDGAGCREFIETEDGDTTISQLWNTARAEGWTGKHIGEKEWVHYCPDCSSAFAQVKKPR